MYTKRKNEPASDAGLINEESHAASGVKNNAEMQNIRIMKTITLHRTNTYSTGCVLMSAFGLNSVNSYINNIQKYYDNEEISIRIIDAL